MRSNNVTQTALVALLLGAAGCSQGGQDQGATTSALTPTVAPPTTLPGPTPDGNSNGGAVPPASNVAPDGVAPNTGALPPSPGSSTVDVAPSTDVVPPGTNSSSEPPTPDGTPGPGPEVQPPNDCTPTAPPVEACTDNINEDQPDLPCSQWVEWGTCDESWMIERHVCDRSCGRCTDDVVAPPPPVVNTCTDSPDAGMAQTPPQSTPPPVNNEGPTLPPVEGGEAGFTTRYWDCCKPHCGWPGNAGNPISSCDRSNASMGEDHGATSACNGGPAHMCWNFVPQTNGDNIAFAYAAHNGVGCGTCFQLDFTGESKNPKPDTGHDFGSQSLKGKSMIVQVINTGGIEPGQFDLLVPGGGVGEFNACSDQWGGADLGEQYGGFFLACQKEHDFDYEPSRQCARDWCDRVFSDKPELHAGCSWFVEWFALADNPTMVYKQVDCPSELSSISGL